MTLPPSVDPATPILIVDDLPPARKVLKRMLGHIGFTSVNEAQSRKEALEKLLAAPHALVITDLHLKDGLGTELLATVKGDPALRDKGILFIIVTSDMDKEAFKQAVDAGVTSYLLKPFNTENLTERVVSSLTKR